MFIFDIETLGKETSSVILSFACIHFNPENKPSYKELCDSAFFAKLNVEDQVKRHKRTMQKSTIEWWNKQCYNAQVKSFIRNDDDLKIEDALQKMREWSNSFNDKKSWVWARGNMDQILFNAYEEYLDLEPIFVYNRWRDVRTAIDIWYETTNGYCEVDYPEFDPALNVTKHDPIQDCAYDVMMMLYGKKS